MYTVSSCMSNVINFYLSWWQIIWLLLLLLFWVLFHCFIFNSCFCALCTVQLDWISERWDWVKELSFYWSCVFYLIDWFCKWEQLQPLRYTFWLSHRFLSHEFNIQIWLEYQMAQVVSPRIGIVSSINPSTLPIISDIQMVIGIPRNLSRLFKMSSPYAASPRLTFSCHTLPS